MTSIWNMWLAMRLLRKNEIHYSFGSIEQKLKENPEFKNTPEFGNALTSGFNRPDRLSVPKMFWLVDINNFILNRKIRMQKIFHPIRFKKTRTKLGSYDSVAHNQNEARNIIDDCLEAGFIKAVPDQNGYIQITKRGSDFSHILYGLKYLKDELGTVISWGVGLIAAFISGGVLTIILKIFEVILKTLHG